MFGVCTNAVFNKTNEDLYKHQEYIGYYPHGGMIYGNSTYEQMIYAFGPGAYIDMIVDTK